MPLHDTHHTHSTIGATCARCSHDGGEHLGACQSDLYLNRTWIKCGCDGFLPA